MKRFNKALIAILSVGLVATNLVGAARWTLPAHLEPLVFPVPLNSGQEDAFNGMHQLPVYPPLREADLLALQAEFALAKEAEKRSAEREEDSSDEGTGARRTKRARKEAVGKVVKPKASKKPAVLVESPAKIARRKHQARLMAAQLYARAEEARKSLLTATVCMTHPDKAADPRGSFILARRHIAKAVEKAEALAGMLREASGTMSVGTVAEYRKLVDLHDGYAADVDRFVAILKLYADAIAAEMVKIQQEAATASRDDIAVAQEPVLAVGRVIEERVSPSMRVRLDAYGAGEIAIASSSASVSTSVSTSVPTIVNDRSLGGALNAQAVDVVNEVANNGWLMQAMRRVIPGMVLGSATIFGIIFAGPIPVFAHHVLPLVVGGGVVGGFMGGVVHGKKL